MELGNYTYYELIEIAAHIEQRGYDLYTKASRIVPQEAARNILLFLADQEKKHEQAFRDMYEKVKEQSTEETVDLDMESIAYLKALSSSSIFPANDEDLTEKIKTLDDVIRIARQVEKDSILFYLELSNYAPDQDTQDFYRLIIEEEKNHLIRINELGKLIKERGVYY